MKIILRADPDVFKAIEAGETNRIEVNKEVRDFLLSQKSENAVVMTGYPVRPRTIKKNIASVLFDCRDRSWVVFSVDCGACVRFETCEINCDGVNYEKREKEEHRKKRNG